ncbi:MAG: hypothetical protein V7K53_30980 [Nostoc sp.]|uniref:hypothetical protein n=1 Tax=Nostoc sp. TaxID=1180 RepID=UPI002FFC4DDD
MIPIVIAPYAPVAHAMTALAPLNPLSTCGEGKQSADLVGWGSLGFISNQADMILHTYKIIEDSLKFNYVNVIIER